MEEILVGRMVLFIDTLMLFVDPKSETLNENERKGFILLFLQTTGFVELAKCNRLGNICQMNDATYEAFEHRQRSENNYLSMALDCMSRREDGGSNDKWHYFATSLATIFSREDESVFRCL